MPRPSDHPPAGEQRGRAARAARDPVDDRLPDGRVAVLIPTYNEPVEVLLPVVDAAVRLESLVLTLLPLAVLAVGASPVAADPWWFLALFGTSFAAQQAALWLLSAGSATPLRSIEFDLLRLPATMSATLALLSPNPDRPFEVTRKGGSDDDLRPPGLLVALLALHVIVLGWVAAAAIGVVGLEYSSRAVVVVSTAWAVFNAALVVRALRRATDPRHRPDRRTAVRFATPWPAVVNGRRAELCDLSLAGARVQLFDMGPVSDHVELEIGTGERQVKLRTRVLRQRVSANRRTLHIAFGQEQQPLVSSLLFAPDAAAQDVEALTAAAS